MGKSELTKACLHLNDKMLCITVYDFISSQLSI